MKWAAPINEKRVGAKRQITSQQVIRLCMVKYDDIKHQNASLSLLSVKFS